MRNLRGKVKTRGLTAFCLILVLLVASGGMTYAAPPVPGGGPQEIQVKELNNGQAVALNGEVLVVNLSSNPSTGYGWRAKGLDERILRQLDAAEWVPDVPGKLGGTGTQVLRFAAVGKGRATLNLVYARPWETAVAPAKTFSLDVGVTEPSKNVSYPDPVAVAPVEAAAAAPDATALGVPTAYNWCSVLGGCTPVRNQGSCGSCWAFATVGALEQSILIKDGVSRDLSEQYLVSCNSDGWSCSGGWWAHDYHQWKFLPAQPGPGGRYESDFPYTATNAACGGPYASHETIASWAYVGNSSSVPSTAAIKQAIVDHGPVTAAVCVNSAFQAYTGGVFNPSGFCFSINHGIVLVGWDDSVGAWILRNSWGPNWGENGYMRIAYGKSYVGYAASYVLYDGSTPPAAPSGLAATAVSSSQVDLAWTDNASNETGFKIERCTGTDCSDFAPIATVGANVTSYSDTGPTASTSYIYRVRAYNAGGDSDYSNTATAVTQALPPAPAAPTNLAASAVSSSQINLTWADNADNETGVKIERSPDGATWTQIAAAAANATSYSDTGLTASTSYTYRVRAHNDGGDSDYSNTAIAMTQAAPTTPAAPTNLTATAISRTGINLTWTDNATNETGYYVQRCKGATCTNFARIATLGANVTSYSNTGLTRATTYRYRVYAYNSVGNSGYSNIAAATTAK
jgi:C1A family cysteine protease